MVECGQNIGSRVDEVGKNDGNALQVAEYKGHIYQEVQETGAPIPPSHLLLNFLPTPDSILTQEPSNVMRNMAEKIA
jgi:hypothetical protein